MGKNRKKFIDKKKSATFQLLARDSSDPNPSTTDRVFVRVDNNPYPTHGFLLDDGDAENLVPGGDDDPNSIFADAPEDDEFNEKPIHRKQQIPTHIRREILELGLPDDGYNYLLHLREIKNTGGGSSYYHNSKAKLEQLPLDVKAYDASRVRVNSEESANDSNVNSFYSVAAKTVGVKIQKAVDPDVAALLDDSNLSQYDSDAEDLEEDFVVQANLREEEDGEEKVMDKRDTNGQFREVKREDHSFDNHSSKDLETELIHEAELRDWQQDEYNEKPRVHRLLDEQFDLLTLREYNSDSDGYEAGSIVSEEEALAAKFNPVLKEQLMEEIELGGKYKGPADILHGDKGSVNEKQVDASVDIIHKCAEYAEKYAHESEDSESLVVLQESSDESEIWDCETVLSTYSNLDNIPGRIQAPEKARKKLSAAFSEALGSNSNVISLRGKEKIPLEFLPHGKKTNVEKEKKVASLRADEKTRKLHGEESKGEKKERKAAVKEEKREARRAKKELKGLYRGEAQRAQKVAAIKGPSAVHLM